MECAWDLVGWTSLLQLVCSVPAMNIASFPSHAQLFVAWSTEKREMLTWYLFSCEHDVIDKINGRKFRVGLKQGRGNEEMRNEEMGK